MVISFRPLLVFIVLSIKRKKAQKKKIKYTLLRLFDNPLSKYLILIRISSMQWLIWVVYQNEKGV